MLYSDIGIGIALLPGAAQLTLIPTGERVEFVLGGAELPLGCGAGRPVFSPPRAPANLPRAYAPEKVPGPTLGLLSPGGEFIQP
ncbi:hypothetical protein [Streptomyces fuscichromogenes]|uniref:Uncharacterized protein n=1 Tax=Streptomyces fuscichromogenes TaxID=1324013 RepID=A0A917XFW3_9ACTN|nr:hypothetical protein [Streptomyces fuscichromogenes]GGN21852.1 hypothetical protein GCM10011578_053280 [Streptomyces fuscichromogenes]